MTDTEVDRAIEDAKSADQEVFIRDENGKVFTDDKPHPKGRRTGGGRQQPLNQSQEKYRRYGQSITVTHTTAGSGLPPTKHWTSGGTTATTKCRTPPLADHQPIVEGGM